MRPSLLDEMSWRMAEVYGGVTDQILINLARHFKRMKPGDPIPGAFEYQARMLAQIGQVNKETAQIIFDRLGDADEALKGCLETSIMDALKNEEPKLRKAAQRGLLLGGVPELDPGQMNAFRMYYRQSADKLNLVNTVMLESTEQAYRATVSDIVNRVSQTQGILNTATGEVVTGVSSWNSAMYHSVRKMVDNGLTGFIDHAGRRWSPEAYAAMDIRTTMFNTARAAIWERADAYGDDLYQVSSHNGARPLCFPWQGKVISRTDNVREVEDLDGNKVHVYAQSETSYGEAAGLFGINCKHYPMSFVPGLSTLRGEPQDEEANEKTYEESQQQRALERKLREEKRELAVLKAEGATDAEINAQRERVKAASAEIDDFCDETGRARRKNREYTPVNAKFPNPDTYDVTEFTTTQRDQMREYFQTGNVTQNPTTQNVQNVVPQATNPAPKVVQSSTPDIVEQAIGVKKGSKMAMSKAYSGANPEYKTGAWEYKNNCQRCVQTYELRRRGYNVTAMPKKRRNDNISWGSEIFNGYGKTKYDAIKAYKLNQTEQAVKTELANAPAGSRYSIYIQWKGGSAHVFIAEKTKTGVKYVDPQSGQGNVSDYFNGGRKGKFGFFRMDDKPLTTDANLISATVRK